MAFLSIQGAQKRYGDAVALDDISLEVKQGELIALLGPSGSGKSTLLMAVAGFVPLDHGNIALNGASIAHLPPFKRDFGVVFQQYALFPHMTVEQNVAYPLRVRGVRRAEQAETVARCLSRVQLSKFGERYPGQLSGGQQQRVALARALAFEPSLLLMDEPLGALDRKLRVDMQREIREIQQELGITTLYVTHDQDEAMSLADRIAVVNHGKIEQLASPLDIYDRPSSPFVANFIGEANLIQGTIDNTNEDGATVIAKSGLIIQVGATHWGHGQNVTVLLRPEHISLGAQTQSRRTAVVRQCTYFGTNIRCVLDLDGEYLISVVPRRQLAFEPVAGSTVAVFWDKAEARVLASSNAGTFS